MRYPLTSRELRALRALDRGRQITDWVGVGLLVGKGMAAEPATGDARPVLTDAGRDALAGMEVLP